MKKIIDNWVHIPGVHCGSVTLMDVMRFNGYDWSEAMCFGIGGGLGFYYSRGEDISPTRMIFVRGPNMETSFFSIIDKPTSWKHADGLDNPLKTIRSYIDKDIPVIIQTDIFYLHYYNSNTHFPGHIISVWGYDDESEEVYVADNTFEGLLEVPYTDFKKGMSSKEASNPLSNSYIDADLESLKKPLEELIPISIRNNAEKMLQGAVGSRGESGVMLIKLWSDDLPNWRDVDDWKWCARFGYQVIKKRGVGGGGFRWIYRDFLLEAEQLIPALKEHKLSHKMDMIGNKWSDAAILLKNISENDSPDAKLLAETSVLANELWELESEFYNTVLEKI